MVRFRVRIRLQEKRVAQHGLIKLLYVGQACACACVCVLEGVIYLVGTFCSDV